GLKPRLLLHRLLLQVLLAALTATGSWAHDPSSYGGVFRSRNLGGSWLSADVGLFLNAALVVAINPRDQSHLLAGTDLGVLVSRNGGRRRGGGGPRPPFWSGSFPH